MMSFVLSACSDGSRVPNASSLEKAAQSVAQMETVIGRKDVSNCQGDSPTGPSIYLTYIAPLDGRIPNKRWEEKFRAANWKVDTDKALFHRQFDGDDVVAVVNQTLEANTYAIVLYLERGELICSPRG